MELATTFAVFGRRTVFFLAAILALAVGNAMAQTTLWSTPTLQYSSPVSMHPGYMARDASGNVFVAATCVISGQNDLCVAKLAAGSGAVLWSQSFNGYGDGDDSAAGVAVDATGGVFVAGNCTMGGTLQNVCVLKLDAGTGALAWSHYYAGQGLGSGTMGMAIDPSGSPVVLGRCRHDTMFENVCVLKLNGASGAQAWASVVGELRDASLNYSASFALDASGNAFGIAQCRQGSGTVPCAFKMTSAGTLQWTALLDGSPGQIALDSGGNAIVSGQCGSSASLCTAKYAAADATRLWSSVLDVPGNPDQAVALRLDGSGNAYVLVRCDNSNSTTATDYCVQKFDGSNGNPGWLGVYASQGFIDDFSNDLAVDSAGNAYVTGASGSKFVAPGTRISTVKFAAADGATAWLQVYESPAAGNDRGNAILLDGAGSVLVTGDCLGTACAFKLDPSTGARLWAQPGITVTVPVDTALAPGSFNVTQNLFARDTAGNLYVTANCPLATWDICVAKYAVNGNLIWSVTWDGSGHGVDTPNAIMVDGKNDPTVVGTCRTGGFVTSLCVIRFDGVTGAVKWSQFVPNGDGRAIVSDSNFDLVVTGQCVAPSGSYDVCTVKLAGGTGALLWTATYDGPGGQTDMGRAIALDAQDNPVVAGTCQTATQAAQICVVLYDGATGAQRMAALYSEPGDVDDEPVAIALRGTSTIFISGHCRAGTQAADFCTLKYTVGTKSGLSLQWATRFAGLGGSDDQPAFLGVGPDGNPIVGGTCRSTAGSQYADTCTVKLDAATGATLWSANYATAFDDAATGGAVDAVGNVFVAGQCGTANSADICTAKYDGATGAQRWIHYVSTGAGGGGGARAVIPTGDSIYVAADYRVDGQQTGIRLFRVSNDASAPSLVSVLRASTSPVSDVSVASLFYTVTFSDAVTGVDTADFTLTTTGTIAGASIAGVSGSGSVYTVTVSHGTGTGTIRLDVLDNDTIVDAALNPLNGVGAGGTYTGGQAFTVVGSVVFTTPSFAGGFYNTAYSDTVAASGGATPYAFSVIAGALPPGISLSSAGTFGGTPTTLGTFSFTVKVLDSIGQFATHAYSITIAAAPQAITFNTLANKPIGSAPFVVSATGGASGNPVTFSTQSVLVCATSGTNGSTVTLLAVGLCTIRASQAGNANYAAAPNVDRFFSVTPSTFQLSVSRSGASSGTVTSSPVGINCGATCIASFAAGSSVTLGVIPDAGSNFTGWSGDCNGLATCVVTMDAARTVSANFQPASKTLTVTRAGTGTGNVLSSPAGIDCGSGCSGAFSYASSITLTPTPAAGSQFTGWSGACTGSGTCAITMDADKSVTATFAVISSVASTTTMSFNPATVTCGAPAPWSATVSGASGTPTGTVTLKAAGGTGLGNYSLTNGVAGSSVSLAGFNGTASYFVVYNGNGTYATSQSTLASITVTKATPGVALASGNNPAPAGHAVTLTATVSSAGVCTTPDGSVTFKDGAATLGTIALDANGVAAFTTSALSSGVHSLTAEYSGGSFYVAGTSLALAQTVSSAGDAHPDFDANGKSDLVLHHTDGRTAIWLMDGLTVASTAGVIGAGTAWQVAHIADLSGDGKSDLIWQNPDGRVSLYLMNGTAATTKTQVLNAGPWTVTQAPDLDGDGKADLLFQNVDGSIAAWLMNGTSMTAGATILGPGTGWSVARVADFDGDGKDDLLFTHTDGRVAIWLMNGLTPTATGQILNAGSGWSVAHTADLNGDGKADIIWRHTDGSIAVWLMNGTAMASGAGLLGAGTGWSVTHTGDFDGDGKADLFFQHTDGRAAIYLMNGLVPTTTTQILNAGSGWSAKRIADMNGDGKSDIVWQNTDGRVAVWLMNGTAMTSSSEILAPATGWSVSSASP